MVTGAALAGILAAAQIAPAAFAEESTETVLSVSDEAEEAEKVLEEAEKALEEAKKAAEDARKAVEDASEDKAEEEAEKEEKKSYPKVDTIDTAKAKVTAIDVSDVVEAVMPSIVMVTNKGTTEVVDFFGRKQKYETQGAASGFIIAQNDDELLIATNNHVVEDSDEVTVAFSVDADDPEKLVAPAKVKGTDPETDLAVIAVKLSDIDEDVLPQLKIAVLGNSDDLKVGETAITIGNSLGEGISVTSGIISALDREITVEDGSTFTEFQTDGAANAGQSGGAIVDANGEVIGVFNAGYVNGDNMGYGIPISTAIPVLKDLVNRETRDALDEHGYMGISVVAVSDEASELYGIPGGAYVYGVTEGSAGDEAGLKKGDVITAFDGIEIGSQEALLRQISYYAPGETVEVTVLRSNGDDYEEETFEIKLDEPSEEVKEELEKKNAAEEDAEKKDSEKSDIEDEKDGQDDSQNNMNGMDPRDMFPFGGNGDGSFEWPFGEDGSFNWNWGDNFQNGGNFSDGGDFSDGGNF